MDRSRPADTRKDVNSLMRMIMDVRKGAAVLTKTWWVDTLWRPGLPIERVALQRRVAAVEEDRRDLAVAECGEDGQDGQDGQAGSMTGTCIFG